MLYLKWWGLFRRCFKQRLYWSVYEEKPLLSLWILSSSNRVICQLKLISHYSISHSFAGNFIYMLWNISFEFYSFSAFFVESNLKSRLRFIESRLSKVSSVSQLVSRLDVLGMHSEFSCVFISFLPGQSIPSVPTINNWNEHKFNRISIFLTFFSVFLYISSSRTSIFSVLIFFVFFKLIFYFPITLILSCWRWRLMWVFWGNSFMIWHNIPVT